MESQFYREGKITIIEGPQRSGKTLAMSILALDEYASRRNKVLTNIAYENPETKKLRIPYEPLNFFELTMDKIETFLNRCITIDELNFYLDNRGSMTKINRMFCQWLLQSKKMGINTYGTTHNLHYLDLRFKENFDFLIRPTTIYETIIIGSNEIKKPRFLVLKWYNGPNQKHFRKTIRVDFHKKPELLNLYNTRHVFAPFAEMEEHIAKQKKDAKTKHRQSSDLHKVVPNFMPSRIDEGLSPVGTGA